MKKGIKLLCIVLAVVFCTTLLTACGQKKAGGQIVIGVDTEPNGDWSYSAFTSSPNATDSNVVSLTDNCTTVTTDKDGTYITDPTIVKEMKREENEDGSVTFTTTINKGLKFNDGSPITAENFLAWQLFIISPAGKEMGTVTSSYDMIPGGTEYRNGEVNYVSGLRLIDEYTCSITILKDGPSGQNYLPYYYDLGYSSLRAVSLKYWFGDGWHVKDDGEGAYLVNDNGLDFTVDTIGDTFKAAQYGTSERVTCGPYNLVSFDKSANQITLEVNAKYQGDYTGRKAGIAKIVLVKVDDSTVIDALATKQIDMYTAIADGALVNSALDLIDNGTIDSSYCQYDRAGFGYFAMACDFGPTQFKEFRQAVAHLLDRTEFAKTFCQGWGSVVHGPYCTALPMYKDSVDLFNKELDDYAFSVEDAVALLKEAGFVYNADGSDYVDGSKEVRYKKVTAEEAGEYQFNVTLDDGTILMPAIVNWASSDGNSVSDLLSTMLANKDTTKEAGVEIKQNVMTFPELLNYMYRQDAYGLGGDYSVPTYNMFNLATSWSANVYDESFNWTTNPDYIADGYNELHLYDEELDKLSMDMVYGVEPDDYATYLDMWQKYVIRYNELLPRVPLYSNIYVTIYPNTITGYEESSFWGFERAILYADAK